MSAQHVQQLQAIQAVCDAVLAAVEVAGPLGAPGGVLYAALMSQGCTLPLFESIMRALCASGRIEKRGDCYFTKGGRE